MDTYDEFIFKQLKRGANTGNLLHHIFERIDFSDDAHWGNIVEAAINRFMPNSPVEHAAQLLQLLHHVTDTAIRVGDTVFSLNKLHSHKKLFG